MRYRVGQGWTVKLPGEDSGALLVRDELVFEGGPQRPPPAAVDLVKGYLRHADLRPQVRLRTLRRGLLMHDARGRLVADIADDAVSVLDGRRIVARFRELEVETTPDTPPGLLDSVIACLRAVGAGAPDPTPKYLRAIGGPGAAPAEIVPTTLDPSATVGDVVGRAIADGVVRLIHHDPVMRLGDDPEGVHQARVATRRLRSDLRTFRAVLGPLWAGDLREALGWLGGELGAARDADVLLQRLTARVEALPDAGSEGARRLMAGLEQRRVQAHAALLDALRGDRYLDLVDRLIQAAQAPPLLAPKANRPAAKALPPLVRRAWHALDRKVQSLTDPPDNEELHRVRILAKRCRYVAEACAPLLGKRTLKLAGAARELQDVLGELNDAVVAQRWLGDFAAHTRSPSGAFAAGELVVLERTAAHQARTQWPRAWKRLRAHAPT